MIFCLTVSYSTSEPTEKALLQGLVVAVHGMIPTKPVLKCSDMKFMN